MSRDITLLHPDLQEKCRALIKKCRENGIEIGISQTFRTKAEQDALYAQGRTKPGTIVTNAKYPQSLHCWGVAFDVYVIRDGRAIWATEAYKPVGVLGESLGLAWGGRWKNFPDYPHFELPGYSYSTLIKKYGNPETFRRLWGENVAGFEKPATVVFEGKQLDAGILHGKTYVEIGELAKLLNLNKSWDNSTKVATLSKRR
jgi:peptidoglycan L-alanyl-D-glutamate endopeptidase CwlK